MQTGWLKDTNENWYYLQVNGVMAKNITIWYEANYDLSQNIYMTNYWMNEFRLHLKKK